MNDFLKRFPDSYFLGKYEPAIWLQDALKLLWRLAYPDRVLPSLKSDLWKEMGWQGPDPSTDFRYVTNLTRDRISEAKHLIVVVSAENVIYTTLLSENLNSLFRGGGFISLENLIFFAQKYQVCILYLDKYYFHESECVMLMSYLVASVVFLL